MTLRVTLPRRAHFFTSSSSPFISLSYLSRGALFQRTFARVAPVNTVSHNSLAVAFFPRRVRVTFLRWSDDRSFDDASFANVPAAGANFSRAARTRGSDRARPAQKATRDTRRIARVRHARSGKVLSYIAASERSSRSAMKRIWSHFDVVPEERKSLRSRRAQFLRQPCTRALLSRIPSTELKQGIVYPPIATQASLDSNTRLTRIGIATNTRWISKARQFEAGSNKGCFVCVSIVGEIAGRELQDVLFGTL